MLKVDIQQVNRYGDTFFSSTDTAYLIFLVIGIVGYFTVPSVASYIVHAGGGNALLYKTSNVFIGGSNVAMSNTTAALDATSAPVTNSYSTQSDPSQNGGDPRATYMHNKLSGK